MKRRRILNCLLLLILITLVEENHAFGVSFAPIRSAPAHRHNVGKNHRRYTGCVVTHATGSTNEQAGDSSPTTTGAAVTVSSPTTINATTVDLAVFDIINRAATWINKNAATTTAQAAATAAAAEAEEEVHINSIVLEVDFEKSNNGNSNSKDCYVLAILPSKDRIHVGTLEQVMVDHLPSSSNNNIHPPFRLALADSQRVEYLCGFTPGSIPPLFGLTPKPLVTFVEESLLRLVDTEKEASKGSIRRPSTALVGGGGLPFQSCRLASLDVLLRQDNVHVASFRQQQQQEEENGSIDSSSSSSESIQQQQHISTRRMAPNSKPFFAVAPPPLQVATAMLYRQQQAIDSTSVSSDVSSGSSSITTTTEIQDQYVSVVGRLSGVRNMSRRLVFCDLAPPSSLSFTPTTTTKGTMSAGDDANVLDYPWRCPLTGNDLAVQLIAGKTLCDNQGGATALRGLKTNRLVLVHGRTNLAASRTSLQNYIHQSSLDIVVFSYQILQEQHNRNGDGGIVMDNQNDKKKAALGLPMTLKNPRTARLPYLQLEELVVRNGNDENDKNSDMLQYIRLIHTIETVQEFAAHLSDLLKSFATTVEAAAAAADAGTVLVGTDCEWKPNFLAESHNDPQPVLLLQVCFYRLSNDNSNNNNMNVDNHDTTTTKENLVVYLLDLQQLLRPGMPPGTEMSPLEKAVSDAFYDLLSSTRLIKTGFQLVNDLRRMASSYPHITAFHQEIHAVLEASTFAKSVLQMTQKKNQRDADFSPQIVIRSLSSLTQHVLGKALDKTEQISDWSQRPLTKTQMEYAALDAVVTPVLVEQLMALVPCQIYCHVQHQPKLGRNENDKVFRQAIMSWRFCFFSQIKDSRAILRLRASKIWVANDNQNGNDDDDDDNDEWHLVSQKWITAEPPPKRPSVSCSGGNAARKRASSNAPFTDDNGRLQVPSKLISIFHNNDEDMAATTDLILKTMVGQRVGKSKEACVSVLIQQAALASSSSRTAFPDGALVDFPRRSGYIELADTVLLFVNMPTVNNRQRRARSYPNDWLNNGQILTWFLRENDWKNGRSSLAQKLTSPTLFDTTNASTPSLVILFLRLDKGHFLCCGRCRVTTKTGQGEEETAEWGSLVQLYLNLLDWNTLINTSNDFVELVHPERATAIHDIDAAY